MPVVMTFTIALNQLVVLEHLANDVTKFVIEMEPGQYLARTRVDIWYDVAEVVAWRYLHTAWDTVYPLLRSGQCVMCGGKVGRPFYWSEDTNNVFGSCGRVVQREELDEEQWRCAKNRPAYDRIYRCPNCFSRA